MMLQELYDSWTEIQKRYGESQTAGSALQRTIEELNVLEGMRLSGCNAIPGETSDVQFLIDKRYKQLEEILRKRNG